MNLTTFNYFTFLCFLNAQDALWNSLTMETNVQCILSIADIFVSIHMHQFQREQIDLGFNLQTYLNFILVKSKFQHLASVQAALFPVEAVVLTHLGNSDTVCPDWYIYIYIFLCEKEWRMLIGGSIY